MAGFGLQLRLDRSHVDVELGRTAWRQVHGDGVLTLCVDLKRFAGEQHLVLIRFGITNIRIVGEGDFYAIHRRLEGSRGGFVGIDDDLDIFYRVDGLYVSLANGDGLRT